MRRSSNLLLAFRWLARVICLFSVGMLLLFAFGGNESLQIPSLQEALGFLFFPIGVVLGMLIAWRWEITGGALTLLSLIGFYAWHIAVAGKMPSGPFFLIFAMPGLILLLLGIATRYPRGQQPKPTRGKSSRS